MEDLAELYIERAENEFTAGKILFEVSQNQEMQVEQYKLKKNFTFYSAVISHTYYCIFYSAKAILTKEGIRTYSPNIHKNTLEAFETHLVINGKLDVELLKIYKQMIIRAEELLGIFAKEKGKRGEFTYQKLSQANLEPAMESTRKLR